MENKIFQKFTIKDIVFLAIMSTVMLLSTAVMPLVKEVAKVVYGIPQLVTCFQMSLFSAIAIMKVRKVFSLTFILLFMSAITVAMSPIMAVSNIAVAVLVELMAIFVFKGYKKDTACYFAAMLLPIAGLIVPTIWTRVTAPEAFYKTVENPYVVFGVILGITLISAIGAFLGLKVGKELQKAGVIKKEKSESAYEEDFNDKDELTNNNIENEDLKENSDD